MSAKTAKPPKQKGNRYQHLMLNTLLFALATFAPKLVTFIINSVVTRNLDSVSYGDFSQIQNFCNLVLPIVYITISEAVIRFGSDNHTKKHDVYTTAIMVLTFGYTIFLLLYPLLRGGDTMARFASFVYPYVLASALRTINGHFVRSLGRAKLFAIDGIITTLSTTILTLVFLIPLDMGSISPILATIIADLLSAVFLFIVSKSWRYFKPLQLNLTVSKNMIIYSLFTMPTAVFWWVITTSNRSIIRQYHGQGEAGLYGAISHIPALVTMVSQVFMQAWQMSAFREQKGQEQESFFASIFKSYYTFIFLAISGIVLIVRPFVRLYVGRSFYEQGAWEYVPFLLLGIGISCLVTFLGTIYNAEKRNFMITLTTAIGAGINIGINYLLIPSMGPQGAAIATAIAYSVVFIIRLIDTQRFMNLNINPLSLGANIILLVVQILISLKQPPFGMLWQGGLFIAIILLNFRHIKFLAAQALSLIRQQFGALYRKRNPSPKG